MSLDLALFGLGPRRPVRASAPLRLRLATSTHGVNWNELERVKWAAEDLADAYDAWARSQRVARTHFVPPAGARFIGRGLTREVFRIGDYAVKLAYSDDYRDVNRREAQTWREAPSEIRRYFVPVLAADDEGRWLIMPYVTERAPDRLREAMCDRLFFRYPGIFSDCRTPGNVAMYQGHARLIDYPEDLGQNTRRYAHGRKG